MLKRKMLYSVACMSLLAASLLAGCSSSDSGGGVAASTSAITTPSADGNVQASIGSVTINSPPVVTFALSDELGQPLDPVSFINSGGSIRFYIARISADGSKYESYVPVNDTTSANYLKVPSYDGNEDLTTAAGAAGVAAFTGRFATVSPGVYTYTFKTDVKDTAKTFKSLAYDATLTHTVVAQISRNVIKSGKTVQQASNPYINFRPDGGAVTATREVVSISACNECHGKLGLHGGSRREIMLCVMCHNEGVTVATTGVPIDLKTLVHKIHMGAKLPSIAKNVKYGIGSADYSTVGYPMMSGDPTINSTPADCVKCHKKGTNTFGKTFGNDVDRYKTTPTIGSCSSCHDLTSFTSSTSLAFNTWTSSKQNTKLIRTVTGTAHSGGAQADGTCVTCHAATGTDYNSASIKSITGAHTVFEKSSANKGVVAKILAVENSLAGQTPVITFQLTDSTGKGFAPYSSVSSATATNSISIKVGAMNGTPDFDNITDGALYTAPEDGLTYSANFGTSGTAFSIPISGNATKNGTTYYAATAASLHAVTAVDKTKGIYKVAAKNYGFNLATKVFPLPAPLPYKLPTYGGTVAYAIQATVNTPLTRSTAHGGVKTATAAAATIPVYYDLATGLPTGQSRRQSLDTANCNMCHGQLVGFHGTGRNTVEFCVMCHTPNNPVNGAADQVGAAGDFKVFVHKIHRGPALKDTAYSFEGAIADGYPNDLRRCDACHNSSTPSAVVTTPTLVGAPNGGVAATSTATNDGTRLSSWVAVCTSCHDGTTAGGTILTNPVGHALANQNTLTTNSCASCHAPNNMTVDHTPSR